MIAIVGGGLAGSLLALCLARRGLKVAVFERRSDLRQNQAQGGRSINLALSARGLRALNRFGLGPSILSQAVAMPARAVHPLDGPSFLAPYGKTQDYCIYSISRSGLNAALLQAAQAYPQHIELHFEHRCLEVHTNTQTLSVLNPQGQTQTFGPFDCIIGSDGADSAVRKALENLYPQELPQTEWLSHSYKELSIKPNPQGQFQLEKNALHIWPRNDYMLIALPNADASFTLTLFLANQGPYPSFDSLDSIDQARAFFQSQFPDALALMPHFDQEYSHNPVSKLATLRCSRWHHQNQLLLLGDAAHAIVPFYGQGMNASFEDVLVLDDCLETHGTAWTQVFESFVQARKNNAHAIAELALENFYEMRDHVANPIFQRKRQIELALENHYPNYRSKYAMVTFYPEVPYQEARRRGNAQDAFLMNYCTENQEDIQLETLYNKLQQHFDWLS